MLPDGITVEVIVVNQVSAGHLFVQQHTHPTFHALRSLDQQMYLCYSQPGIPTLPTPVESKCCPGGQRGSWALARLGEKLWGVSCCSALGLDREEAVLDPSWEQHPWVLAVGMECAGLSFLASPIWRFHRLTEERRQSRVLAPGFGPSSATYLLSGADAHLIWELQLAAQDLMQMQAP